MVGAFDRPEIAWRCQEKEYMRFDQLSRGETAFCISGIHHPRWDGSVHRRRVTRRLSATAVDQIVL